jgi:hypothetical protein
MRAVAVTLAPVSARPPPPSSPLRCTATASKELVADVVDASDVDAVDDASLELLVGGVGEVDELDGGVLLDDVGGVVELLEEELGGGVLLDDELDGGGVELLDVDGGGVELVLGWQFWGRLIVKVTSCSTNPSSHVTSPGPSVTEAAENGCDGRSPLLDAPAA